MKNKTFSDKASSKRGYFLRHAFKRYDPKDTFILPGTKAVCERLLCNLEFDFDFDTNKILYRKMALDRREQGKSPMPVSAWIDTGMNFTGKEVGGMWDSGDRQFYQRVDAFAQALYDSGEGK